MAIDLDSYDEEMDDLSPELLDERMKQYSPAWWCRVEAYRLGDLLKTHVTMALETGTDLRRVMKLLENVRSATLDATMEGES